MNNIKILDCTLRDGGYVNSWNFGYNNIINIVKNLTESQIDFIELGFLKPVEFDKNKTLYDTLEKFSEFIPSTRSLKISYMAMITYGEYSSQDIPVRKEGMVDGVRIIFKKKVWRDALKFCRELIEKGYKVFVNPMHTYAYSDKELLELIEEVNLIRPYGISIVDTMGIMRAKLLLHIFSLFDYNLKDGIAICFHSHNNLQLSFSNAISLLELRTKREIVIDSSVRGIGRGAGNLCTELLLQHLNETYDCKYNLLPILKIADECINKIFNKTPWGYNIPYYLAASCHCHPNYASFLNDKQTISIEAINALLSSIPEDKKNNYDEQLIQTLYLNYQENHVDDKAFLEELKNQIKMKEVLILGSGKTLSTCHNVIQDFIINKKPFIFSLNFKPEYYCVDYVFISNVKRFLEQKEFDKVIVTSNIKANNLPKLNYGSYLNNSSLADNSLLMLIKVLINIGIRNVSLAGCDGFELGFDNYVDNNMINNAKLGEFDERNQVMATMLDEFSKFLNINFLTPSKYRG